MNRLRPALTVMCMALVGHGLYSVVGETWWGIFNAVWMCSVQAAALGIVRIVTDMPVTSSAYMYIMTWVTSTAAVTIAVRAAAYHHLSALLVGLVVSMLGCAVIVWVLNKVLAEEEEPKQYNYP